MKKILLAASSSGGHIFPILGLYEALKKEFDFTFVGIKKQMEEKYFPRGSIFLDIGKSFRKNRGKEAQQKLKKELFLLKNRSEDFDAFLSGGGYCSYLLSKISQKKPLFLLEQNVHLGDANLYAGFKAKKIFLSFPITHSIHASKFILTGNPCVDRFTSQEENRDPNQVAFVFGSLSSETLLQKTMEYFHSSFFLPDIHYLLISGIAKEKIIKKNVTQISYLEAEKYLATSALLFTRAGGCSLSEILKFHTPSVLIPSPYVKHHHQEKNAFYMKKMFHIPVLKEKEYQSRNIAQMIQKRAWIQQSIFWGKKENPSKKIGEILHEILS